MKKKYIIIIIYMFCCNKSLARFNKINPNRAPEIYQKYCRNCHASGVSGAPLNGDRKEWRRRINRKGIDRLVENVKTGKGGMPPGGMCGICTDEDIKNTIEYMSKRKKNIIKMQDIF